MGRHHARVYAGHQACELVGVMDSSPERAAEVGERHGVPVFQSEAELIDAGVQAVSIAVPTTLHRRVAEPFLRAGVACLVEKPLAENGEQAEVMKRIAEEHGAILMVGHIERFNPVMRAMQRATQDGRQVVPRFIEVHRVSPMTFRSVDIGVVMDMMIHDLDVVLWLMGGREPSDIRAAGVKVVTQHEDLCNARLQWDLPHGRCVANITASRLALKTERVTRITGENAYIKIDYGAKKGIIIRRIANEIQLREVAEQLRRGVDLTDLKWADLVNYEELAIDDTEPIVAEIEAFLEAVRSGNPPPIDAEAGLVNVRVAERIVRAIQEFM
ncbi:MAG: Gfo/Idh/MocA family oxidoreductase [Phycisphaeraceae bacterium]|nr:Gfo/Idh/MocA family oxidoreductase [Phycisphaeraceae bacterium]MCW5754682.1 Gfo/Idh/MocA family oxidoreductase [Phycisphaeraceae bacterium]